MLGLVALAAPGHACELCDGPGSSFVSLQNHIETWPLAAVAVPEHTDAEGRTRFRITEVLKGTPELRVGDRVTPEGKRVIAPRQLWVLLGVESDLALGTVLMLRPATASFLRAIPGLPPPDRPAERLRALVPWLQHADPLVSASARKEFAEAPYAAVRATARLVPLDPLLEVLANPRAAASSRGTLFLLLGLRAGPAERKRLGTWMRDPAIQAAPGYAALLAAWLMSTKAAGLEAIHRALAAPGADRGSIGRALVLALGFHARNEDDLSRLQILAELDRLLESEGLLEAIAPELVRLEAWGALEAVMSAYERSPGPSTLGREAVIAYLRAHPGRKAEAYRAALERAAAPAAKGEGN